MEGRILTYLEVWELWKQNATEQVEDVEILEDAPKIKNKNLSAAKKLKNDEFYTQLADIEKELFHYKDHFRDKVIYLNCDGLAHDADCEIHNGEECTCCPCTSKKSEFWNYFRQNFYNFGIKKVIATRFDSKYPTYKLELTGDTDADGELTDCDIVKTRLVGNGDFRNKECIDILKEADLVITNPPFSLFREYIALMEEHKKKFIVLGNNNAITYKEIFKLIKENKLWLGNESNKTLEFRLSSDYTVFNRTDVDGNKYGKVPAISWFTNIPHSKRNEKLILAKTYKGNESLYPKYDNYDAIEVSKISDIPSDYQGVMGVPITFLDKFNPEQFEIVGNEYDLNIEKGRCYINNIRMYSRILIKRK